MLANLPTKHFRQRIASVSTCRSRETDGCCDVRPVRSPQCAVSNLGERLKLVVTVVEVIGTCCQSGTGIDGLPPSTMLARSYDPSITPDSLKLGQSGRGMILEMHQPVVEPVPD